MANFQSQQWNLTQKKSTLTKIRHCGLQKLTNTTCCKMQRMLCLWRPNAFLQLPYKAIVLICGVAQRPVTHMEKSFVRYVQIGHKH